MPFNKSFNSDFFKNILLIFKPKLLFPTKNIENFEQLPKKIEEFDKIEAIIFDLDQTLLPYGESKIKTSILKIIEKLQYRYSCCILSNYPRTKTANRRIKNIESQTGLKVILSKKRKPAPSAYLKALKLIQSEPDSTLMVGDRIFTDIMGANNLGIRTLFIKPQNIKKDPFLMITIPRVIEKILVKFYVFLGRGNSYE